VIARDARISEILKERATVLAQAYTTNAGTEFVRAFEGENYEHGLIGPRAIVRVHQAAQSLQDKIHEQGQTIKDIQDIVTYYETALGMSENGLQLHYELKRALGWVKS
jgi:hypothetical protein